MRLPLWVRLAGVVVLAATLMSAAAAAAVAAYIHSPAGNVRTTIDVVIPSGSTLTQICALLHAQDVVFSPRLFCVLARIAPRFRRVLSDSPIVDPARILPGTYRLSGGSSPLEILASLKTPSTPAGVRLTIPEGATIWAIARLLDTRGVASGKEFLNKALNRTYASAVVGWDTPSLEGYLFPDTYVLERRTPVDAVVSRLVRRFKEKWNTHYAAGGAASGMTPHQLITMASIIEKEAGPGEQRLVSRVLHNRLKAGWRFESCATVIYGLLPEFDGNLRREDLSNRHPYNTYVWDGFPPGPIASPGEAALVAALDPGEGCYRFFVARNDGTNAFSCTWEEHQRLVNNYQSRAGTLGRAM